MELRGKYQLQYPDAAESTPSTHKLGYGETRRGRRVKAMWVKEIMWLYEGQVQ